jgi:2-polyprenyl-3-methyl-5-hydroxy-6-metoxy-1,4-benzoquinol methylase
MSLKPLKILVVIANYGSKNDVYLQRLLQEYRSCPYEVSVVVLSNTPKHLDADVEILVEQPVGDPWNFPFAHKAILAKRLEDYDLFIYSEDDTLITERNITAFLNATHVLAENEIAGFMRVEQLPDGQRSVSTMNSHFHWDPTSVVRRGQYTFAFFTNEHAASYILTREQLRKAIKSKGYLVDPHQEKYDLLVTAATDPYTQCGFRKLVCISHIEDFLITHLPNKYLGQLGVEFNELQTQLDALAEIESGLRPATVLLATETKVRHLRWSKSFYEPVRHDVLSAIPSSVRTLLSFGCGMGALESELRRRGIEVTEVPLDSVIGACAAARGINIVHGDTETVFGALSDRRFDAVIVLDLLHLVPMPVDFLRRLRALLVHDGIIVATVPNIAGLRTKWKRIKGDMTLRHLARYDRSGVHEISGAALIELFTAAGFTRTKLIPRLPAKTRWWKKLIGDLFPMWLAEDFIIQAQYDEKTYTLPGRDPMEAPARICS